MERDRNRYDSQNSHRGKLYQKEKAELFNPIFANPYSLSNSLWSLLSSAT